MSPQGRSSLFFFVKNVMQLKSFQSSTLTAFTVATRPARPRVGVEHAYTLNGSELRDVLIDGRWVTLSATAAPSQAA
ncbi:hypothetical protein ACV229_36770 [Burkholderia sp. MR1-5-21]